MVDIAVHPFRAAVEAAYREADEAWGESDGRHALPQAVQLQNRIRIAEAMINDFRQRKPDEGVPVSWLNGKLALKHRYSDMLRDKDDQARCERWQAAFAAFETALAAYSEEVKRRRDKGILPEMTRERLGIGVAELDGPLRALEAESDE